MSERERFEAWARTQPRHEGASMRFLPLNNAYIDFDLHGAWLAWQAARSGQAASGSSQGARSDDLKNLADALTRFYANTPVWAPEDRMTLAEAARLIRSLADSPASAAAARVGQPEAPTADRRCKFCNGGASGSWCPTAEGCAAHGCHGECLPEDQEAPTAAALVAECAPYLKEGETPLQRIQRDAKDMDALLTLLSREKRRSMGLAEKLAARSGAGSEEGGQG